MLLSHDGELAATDAASRVGSVGPHHQLGQSLLAESSQAGSNPLSQSQRLGKPRRRGLVQALLEGLNEAWTGGWRKILHTGHATLAALC
jgi:hypothetical protein